MRCIACVRWMVQEGGVPLDKLAEGPLRFFMFAVRGGCYCWQCQYNVQVTIVVVAVPEGLPLAVTISLGYRFALTA